MSQLRTKTRVLLNLSVPELAGKYAQLPSDGVGLMRAEFLAMSIGTHPQKLVADGGSEEFISFFAEKLSVVARAFAPRPVVYRTLDLKSNEYAGLAGGGDYEQAEANPMLGFRGCSRYLEDTESFRLELRAVKRVLDSGLDNVRLMLPFVRFPAELEFCRGVVREEGLLDCAGFQLWMMAELPSNILAINQFLPFVSGVSIGSNDLTQLVLGIDRDSQRLAGKSDASNPAVLAGIELIAAGCRALGTPLSICGDAPSRQPQLVEKLIAFGLNSISVPADAFEDTCRAVEAAEERLGLAPRDSSR